MDEDDEHSPSEFYYPEDLECTTFDVKTETGITQSFLYGPRCARPALPQPRANILQYSPRAWLVRG